MRWLRARDPDLRAVTRGLRVALAAVLGFYVCRFGFGEPVAGLYAMFGANALGGLSQVSGTRNERGATFLTAGLVGAGLVVLGTYAAANPVVSVLGVLAVGFLVAFAGAVGGPTVQGLSRGLQLMYILPSFPPASPSSLGVRLGGLAGGTLLITAADRWIRPDPPPARYEDRMAAAAEAIADHLAAVLAGSPPPVVEELSGAAHEAAVRLRPSLVPDAERPAAPTRHAMALTQAAELLRALAGRVRQLAADLALPDVQMLPVSGGPSAARAVARDALAEVVATLRDSAALLSEPGRRPRQAGADPTVARRMERLAAKSQAWESARARALLAPAQVPAERRLAGLLSSSVAGEILDAAALFVAATSVARGERVAPPQVARDASGGSMWYARLRSGRLALVRARSLLSLRSVALHNALRVAVALAAARAAAAVIGITHGFWVLLATLAVMRTSAADTRVSLRAAVTGAAAGAVVTALAVAGVGQRQVVYVVALPLLLFAAFVAGPLLGPGWAQAAFTLAIVAAFAEVSTVTWHLAEVRFEAVVLGGVVGTGVGLLAWPRGATGQLRRQVALGLDASAGYLAETTAVMLGDAREAQGWRPARRALTRAEAARAQALSERRDPGAEAADWQAILLLGHRVLRGGELLRIRYPQVPQPSAPARSIRSGVRALGDRRAREVRALAAAVDRLPRTPAGGSKRAEQGEAGAQVVAPVVVPEQPLPSLLQLLSSPGDGAGAGRELLRMVDAWGWLAGTGEDVRRAWAGLRGGDEAASTPTPAAAAPAGPVGGHR